MMHIAQWLTLLCDTVLTSQMQFFIRHNGMELTLGEETARSNAMMELAMRSVTLHHCSELGCCCYYVMGGGKTSQQRSTLLFLQLLSNDNSTPR